MYPTGICYQAYIPMRKEATETSEMVNQVLFGESFSVLEENKAGNFSFIRLHHDKYEGWINTRSIYFLSDKEWEELSKLSVIVSHEMINFLKPVNSGDPIAVGCGSLFRLTSHGKTKIFHSEYILPETNNDESTGTREKLVKYGLKLLSVPYLWGGRSGFGFDCSGLCQNLYRQAGIEIPRNASMQASLGRTLSFIAEAREGDLAFFDNDEGIITHVGMILGDNRILHASGKVKIDQVDHQGIFSTEQNRYTHKLRLVKSLVD